MKKLFALIMMLLMLSTSISAIGVDSFSVKPERAVPGSIQPIDPSVFQWDAKGELTPGRTESFRVDGVEYEVKFEDRVAEDGTLMLFWNVNGNGDVINLKQQPIEIYPPAYYLPATVRNEHFTLQVVDLEWQNYRETANAELAQFTPKVTYKIAVHPQEDPVIIVPDGEPIKGELKLHEYQVYKRNGVTHEITFLAQQWVENPYYEDADQPTSNTAAEYYQKRELGAKLSVNGFVTPMMIEGQKAKISGPNGQVQGTLQVLNVNSKTVKFVYYPIDITSSYYGYIYEGQSKTYTVNGREYEVTNHEVQGNSAKIEINNVEGAITHKQSTRIGRVAIKANVYDWQTLSAQREYPEGVEGDTRFRGDAIQIISLKPAAVISPEVKVVSGKLREGQTVSYRFRGETYRLNARQIEGNVVVFVLNNEDFKLKQGMTHNGDTYRFKLNSVVSLTANTDPYEDNPYGNADAIAYEGTEAGAPSYGGSNDPSGIADPGVPYYAGPYAHYTLTMWGDSNCEDDSDDCYIYPDEDEPDCTEANPCTNMPYPDDEEPVDDDECTEDEPCFAPNPYPDEDIQNQWQNQEQCQTGCSYESNCLPVGTRVANGRELFCAFNKNMEEQKGINAACQNDYECTTNSCSSGTCHDLKGQLDETQGMIKRLFNWLEKIF